MKTRQSNIDIHFEYYTSVEGDNNRGWRVDKVIAAHKSKQVGYLKLAYIPLDRYNEYYPTIFNWMDQIRGMCILPRATGIIIHDEGEYRAASCRHYSTFTKKEAFHFLNRLSLNQRYCVKEKTRENLCHAELLWCIEDCERTLLKGQLGKEFKQFKQYYVDKPIDDFVRVEDNYQRQGIAENMYEVATLWLAKRKLPLYLSTLRHPHAKALSDKMRDNGHLETLVDSRERFIVDSFAPK